jgi:voltage-gated potassium channel
MAKDGLARLAHHAAPFRRLGASSPARYVVLAVGLAAMTAFTIPDLPESADILLQGCLWCCLAYFAVEGADRARAAFGAGLIRNYIFSPTGFVDLLSVVPVPVALIYGVAPPTAWLFGSLWVLKLAQNSPGLAQLGRLASVMVLFLIVLFLTSAAVFVLERNEQPRVFGTLSASLWWAVVTLTTTGYGDKIPITYLGRTLAAFVMICGIATFGLLTGILATGFAAERRRRNFIQTWDLVSKVPFFQSLDPAAITEITHMLRRLEVSERTVMIRRGKIGDCMYFIADGEVQVDVSPNPVRLGSGAFFGELALLGDSVRTANVSTTAPSTLLMLDLADFRTLMAHHPDLARAIEAEGERRLTENQCLREVPSHDSALPSSG